MILKNYKFDSLSSDLKIGREIEFAYNEKYYSITNAAGFYFFTCATDNLSVPLCRFEDKENLVMLISKIELANINLKNIFDKLLYDQKSLYVL